MGGVGGGIDIDMNVEFGDGIDVNEFGGDLVSGLEFDALELRLVRPPWAVVRLLLLGADATKQPRDGENSGERPGCQLTGLPTDALRLIVRML